MKRKQKSANTRVFVIGFFCISAIALVTKIYSPKTVKSSLSQEKPNPDSQESLNTITIPWQLLVDQLYKNHDISPSPGWPSNFKQAYSGSPSFMRKKKSSRSKNKPQNPNITPAQKAPNYKHLNWWNHVFINGKKYPRDNNLGVAMGPVKVALLINGQWQTHELGSSCKGRLSKIGNVDSSFIGNAPTCHNGIAKVGLGHQDWRESDVGYHGWSGQRLNRPRSGEIKAVAAWFPAKLTALNPREPANLNAVDQYVVKVGVDLRTGQKSGLPSIISGREQMLYPGGQWTPIIGHSISMDRWEKLCLQNNLPQGFPFEKGCNIQQ